MRFVSDFQLIGSAGCAEFHFSADDLQLNVTFRRRGYLVRGQLTEEGTNVTQEVSKELNVEYVKMRLITGNQRNKHFKPGLPYIDQVREIFLLPF